MDVSIILVNYNTCEITRKCIDSIFERTTDISFEVILVDNASSDNSREVFENERRITYLYNQRNLGFGLANNMGFKVSTGRNILFLNTDTIIMNNAIKEMSDYMDKNLIASACGGNLYDEKMSPTHSYRMFFPSIFGEVNNLLNNIPEKILWGANAQFNRKQKNIEVGYITGADLMVKRSVLDELGVFSDKFFMYYEETELQYRFKKHGLKIYSLPNAKIQHLEGKSMGKKKYNIERMYLMDRGRDVFYSLCYGSFYKWISDRILIFNVFVRYLLLFVIGDERYIFHKQRIVNLLKMIY